MDFVPASIENADSNLDPSVVNIVDGVLEVTIPHTIYDETTFVNQTAAVVEGWVTEVVAGLGIQWFTFSHVMYVVPESTDFSTGDFEAAGYAYVGWYLSVFDGQFTADLWLIIHEVGHNMGLQHSGILPGTGVSEFGDLACYMGSNSTFNDEGPKMCFNGPKSYYLNWYSDRHADIDPSKVWEGKLVGIDDYLNGQTIEGEHYVIAKVGYLFLLYNRAEGVTSELREEANTITVTRQKASDATSLRYSTSHVKRGSVCCNNDADSMVSCVQVCRAD